MVWYNPRSWFEQTQENVDIYCHNPQCGSPLIEEGVMLYDGSRKSVYHDADCANLALAHEALKSKEAQFLEVDVISRKKAMNLSRKGMLDLDIKRSRLENNVVHLDV